MAFITVNNAEVVNTFYNGQGAKLKETFKKRDGSEGSAYYSAFFNEPHGLAVGAKGKFNGQLGVKASSYEKDGETKHGVDVTLNGTQFTPSDDQGNDDPFA